MGKKHTKKFKLLSHNRVDRGPWLAYNTSNRTPRTSQRCAPGETFFYRGHHMSTIKPHLTYDQQLQRLKDRGCIIVDDEFCKTVLANISYYRLSAYFLPFKNADDSYKSGTDFTKVYRLYEFDRKLRSILFGAIEVIEVYLRAKLAYYHAGKYGPLGYLNPATFNNKHDAEKFKNNIDREIENNKKVLFVKHHLENYDGQFPLWVISELFTFGTISYFYNDLTTADKKEFAGSQYDEMVSWLRCCTDLRNICAHYGRLYYRVFTAMPKGFNIPDPAKRRLWGAILSIRALYPSPEKWNREVMPLIAALFKEHENDVDLYHIAFPRDWEKQLLM